VLSQAVLKGLAKDPKARHSSCAALAAVVGAAVATAKGVATGEERVRLKCPGCGKTGSITAVDFTRFKAVDRPLPCPACKTPMETLGSGTSADGSGSGSGETIRFSALGSSSEYALQGGPGPAAPGTVAFSANRGSGPSASAHTPMAPPGGTIPLSTLGPGARQPPAGEPRPPSAPRGAPTVIERAAPISGNAAATAVCKSISTSENIDIGERTTRPSVS
jgi:hypothetical protein